MAWLPVKKGCPAQADGAPDGGMCFLDSEVAAEELPSLSFRYVECVMRRKGCGFGPLTAASW